MTALLAPVLSALRRTARRSSPWPRSAQNATTSQPYSSINQRKITEVSNPPEYARTTLSIFISAFFHPLAGCRKRLLCLADCPEFAEGELKRLARIRARDRADLDGHVSRTGSR